MKRNSGEEYETKESKPVSGKLFQNKDCLCSKKLINGIGYEYRRAKFDSFWKLASFEKQNWFPYGLARKQSIKQRRPRNYEGYMRKCSFKTDGRCKMVGSSRKTDEEKIKVVREHILSFPACESQYTRSHHTSSRKYLSADLDIRKMYIQLIREKM
ncbi:uncharacterized protein LOC128870010 [Anastrepha ludens]|uniref:uncharacterized protein LOC128870010 n=1 Tax=Anastrepha ludens TaxID=28586 RepID=UPI0023B0C007|nr:uncharacterized protein LOC128870010 [Anastrepha ludens]